MKAAEAGGYVVGDVAVSLFLMLPGLFVYRGGHELTAVELQALATAGPEAIRLFAQSIDRRIRKATVDDRLKRRGRMERHARCSTEFDCADR